MGVDIATWCLEGEASSYLGDINEEELPTDLEELSFLLQHRFGKSFNARLFIIIIIITICMLFTLEQ